MKREIHKKVEYLHVVFPVVERMFEFEIVVKRSRICHSGEKALIIQDKMLDMPSSNSNSNS
jgi:hypothetical protein